MCLGNGLAKSSETGTLAPLDTGSASFSTMKLSLTGTRAFFTPTLQERLFWLWFIGLPAYGLYFCFFTLKARPDVQPNGMAVWVNILILAVAGGFMSLGYLGFSVGFGTRRVAADGERRTVEIEYGLRGIFHWSTPGKTVLSFDEIAAVQICTFHENGSGDCGPYLAWQINLVLRGTSGERINLVAHSNGNRIRREAAQLAGFLGKPLCDQTSPT